MSQAYAPYMAEPNFADVSELVSIVRDMLSRGETDVYDKVSRIVDHAVLKEVLQHFWME